MKKILALSLALLIGSGVVFASSASPSVTDSKPSQAPSPVGPSQPTVKKPITGLVILGDNYAVDAESVYVVNDTRSAWIKIAADRPTFTVILGQFARDKDALYQMGRKIDGVDISSFSVISGQYGYAQDKNHIYGPQGIVKDADPETFTMLTKHYSLDAGHVYFEGRDIEADSANFEIINDGLYALDSDQVFYAGKVLKDVSPEGFEVKGSRAFAADGRTFFEGQIERGDLPVDDIQKPDSPGVMMSGEVIPRVDEAMVSDAWMDFSEKLAPYRASLRGENAPFWVLVALGILGIFSLIFVFFAHRNDVSVSLWKSVAKTLLGIVFALVGFWVASFFLTPSNALIVGGVVGLFFFVALWSTLGWVKSLLITLLTLIGCIFFGALVFVLLRTVFGDLQSILTFFNQGDIQLMGLLGIFGVFFGAWLIMTQLGSSLVGSLGQAFVATLVSLVILGLLIWIADIGTITSLIVFCLLYAGLLWIMRFRIVSDLFVETVRIVRIVIILAVVIGLVVWIVL